jgi:DNA modification methylase
MIPTLKILQGDALEMLKTLPDESVQCCVTSPPYWGLRDYGVEGMIGLEATVKDWLAALCPVFDQVRRVLKKDGTLWLNQGDCYIGGGNGGGGSFAKDGTRLNVDKNVAGRTGSRGRSKGLKSKDLAGQPWRLAFALQEAGWYLRRDIIWHKPNPMPETVYDRPTTAHEYIFLLTKSAKYFYDFDAVKERTNGNAHARGDGVNAKIKAPDGWDTGEGAHGTIHRSNREKGAVREKQNKSFSSAVNELVEYRNLRSVWTIPIEGYSGAHFATFPTAIPRRCILAGTRAGDTVLDPFAGSGTTGKVALELGRSATLIELNPAYCALIRQRCETTVGMNL